MKNIKFLIAIVFGVSLISCDSNTYDEIGGYVENPTYTNNIKPIIDSKCVTCHYTNNSSFISDLSTYDNVKNSFESGSALQYVSDGTMPKNGTRFSNATLKLINKWITDSYPEN